VTPEPDAFIARILGPDGGPAGVGVLISDRWVITCAHVVNTALGLNSRQQGRPDGTISVDFPIADPHSAPLTAAVTLWLPPPRDGAAGDDIAGLELISGPAPDSAKPARLAVEAPRPGRAVRVFGYPGTPPRPDGSWIATTVVGRVGGGWLQLDSGPDSTLRVQPGFSGSPVVDYDIGRVVGLLSQVPPGQSRDRDSYVIGTDRLRLAWPEALAGNWQRRWTPGQDRSRAGLTILHISDTRFGKHHLFGGNGFTPADQADDMLFSQLHRDLAQLADADGLRPDVLVVTGDLAERGRRSEFSQVTKFLDSVAEAAGIPRRHVAIVPGNHDINRLACNAYFMEQESLEQTPVKPYFPKWREYARAFQEFYADVPGAEFTPDEPWTLFEMPDLKVVIAGLNSTMAESHLDADHYGWVGEHQLQWFARQLQAYRDRGWLRVAAVNHNVVLCAALDEENLRDAGDLDHSLGQSGLVNLLLHGHTHDAKLHHLSSGLPVMSTGSAAIDAKSQAAEVPSRYQMITVRRGGFTRHARQFAPDQRHWVGDLQVSPSGSDWRDSISVPLADVAATLPEEAPSERHADEINPVPHEG
jgi:3',5'-cyclic AMP phosphodiesterase CpdA